jgi:hypothetical protein
LRGFEKIQQLWFGVKEGVMDCRYFEGCSAPLCPRDEGIAERIWFSDEDICRHADIPAWVKRQRKISRKAVSGGYFTLAMLKHDCRMCKGMKGIDPDGSGKERAASESAWFIAHPVITAEERERNRASGLKNKGFLGGTGCKKDPSEPGVDGGSGKKGSKIPPAFNGA